MAKKLITLGESEIRVDHGFTKLSNFYETAEVSPENQCLYLNRDQDIDIPLLPNDHIIIHGGEKIFIGDHDRNIGKNPQVRRPVVPTLNDRKLEQGLTKAKIKVAELQKLDKDLETSKLFVDIDSKKDEYIPDDTTLVVQDDDCYLTIPAGNDDEIDLEECAKHHRKPPKGQTAYKIKIDGVYKIVDKKLTGEQILGLVGLTYDEWRLNKKFPGGRRKSIERDEIVDFSEPGIERFETTRMQTQQGW